MQSTAFSQHLPFDVNHVVVLTGGGGRVEAGLQFSEQDTVDKVLMSGVYPSTSKDVLLSREAGMSDVARNKVEIDHEARTTRENAQNTELWAQERKIEHIALVTAHYHMPRALLLFKQYAPNLKVTPVSVYRDEAPLSFYLREYLKYTGVRLEFLLIMIKEKAPF